MDTYLFHRHRSEWIYGYGTEGEARTYWQRLNSGRVDNLWSVRRHGGRPRGVNLAVELAKIGMESIQ
jgi:hypothetical protein